MEMAVPMSRKKNPIARALRSRHLKPKIVRARKGRGSYARAAAVAGALLAPSGCVSTPAQQAHLEAAWDGIGTSIQSIGAPMTAPQFNQPRSITCTANPDGRSVTCR